jgi:hypothetical protein
VLELQLETPDMPAICNPSYAGGRDQEDHGSKPAWANSSQDPILKKTITKKEGLVEWLKVKVLSSNPSTTKNKIFKKGKSRCESRGQLLSICASLQTGTAKSQS